LTELAGDIVLTCTGGAAPGYGNIPAAGSSTPIPTANITVSFGTNVTSRLLTYSTVTPSALTASNTSEALLLIDEPGSGLAIGPPGYAGGTQNIGPNAPQTLCGSGGSPYSLVGAGNGGCSEYVVNVGGSLTEWVASGSPSSYVPPANMFSGVVSSNQVTFYGIPILPPASAGIARVFRMTNIRINANALGGGGLAGTTQVLASIAISGSTSVPVNQPVQIAGFVQSGLSVSTRNVGNTGGLGLPNNFNQCSSASVSPVTILRYSENFGTAFKTRVAPTTSYDGQSGYPYAQNIPGAIYNSESGFVSPAIYGVSNQSYAGLADYGTRLKAVFNNIPTGVQIFVSTTNVINLTGVSGSGSPYTLGQPAGNSTVSYAQLVISDTAVDGNGTAPTVPVTGYTSPPQTCSTPGCAVLSLNGYAALSVVNNSATAVWEVVNTNPATAENFDFGVWITYSASAATNSPPPGTATVNQSFGPVPPSFVASAGAAVSGSLTIPRFADMSTAANIFTIIQCTTQLLFPFLTNQAGFDTGIAIANTTSDPFGTHPQAGTCSLNFYGQNAPPQFVTPIIPSGNNIAPPGNWAFQASNIAPNFEGYMIAICNFQLAHATAIITDLGAQRLAYGYQALILTNAVTSSRNSNPETLTH
jgi:hypothetical protein